MNSIFCLNIPVLNFIFQTVGWILKLYGSFILIILSSWKVARVGQSLEEEAQLTPRR